jgi:hypothetical protein
MYAVLQPKPNPVAAHQYSSNHRRQLLASDICGCFYCLEVYNPAEITDWVDEDNEGVGKTALCAKCGIDSVLGSASGYPITLEFLKQMRDHWF